MYSSLSHLLKPLLPGHMLAAVHCSYHVSSQTDTRQDVIALWCALFMWFAADWVVRKRFDFFGGRGGGGFFVMPKILYLRAACLEGHYHTCV